MLVTLAAGNGAPLAARSATPPPTATFLPTPSAPGSYFSPLTDGMVDWNAFDPCKPESDGLHIVKSQVNAGCKAPDAAAAADGDLSVVARQTSGPLNAPYGMFLRADVISAVYYAFLITSGGRWSFSKVIYKSFAFISDWRSTAAIHTGLGATNTLEVRFKGAQFTFLVNGQTIGSARDASITATGNLDMPGPNTGDGLFGQASIEVVYTNYHLKPVNL